VQGTPVIKRTRIPVEQLLRKIGKRATERELLDAFPNPISGDIRAAMTYASYALAHEEDV
jgi:uncharacterized protein (DUF433 family)